MRFKVQPWMGVGLVALGAAGLAWIRKRSQNPSRQDTAERILEAGHHLVDQGRLGDALRLGERLLAERYSGGYELVARVYRHQRRLDYAIEVLSKGVARAPAVWPLWEQLTGYLAEDDQYSRALDALDEAERHGAEAGPLLKRRLQLFLDARMADEALELCDQAGDYADTPEAAEEVRCYRLMALAQKDEFEELEKVYNEDAPESMAERTLAVAYGLDGDPRSLEWALRSYHMCSTDRRTLDWIRGQDMVEEDEAHIFKAVAECGRVFWVQAKDKEQAETFVRRLEPDLEFEFADLQERPGDGPCGVLAVEQEGASDSDENTDNDG